MLGILMRMGLWALKFTGKQSLKHPFIAATTAHMATDGKSTDTLLDIAEGSAHVLGKDNTKTIATTGAGVIGSLSLAWAQMTGKVMKRAGGEIIQNLSDGKAAEQEPAAPKPVAPIAEKPVAAAKKTTGQDEPEKEKSWLSEHFSFAANGGGIGAMLGSFMTGNPVLAVLGIILSVFMLGNMIGGKDDKSAPAAPSPK